MLLLSVLARCFVPVMVGLVNSCLFSLFACFVL